MKRLALLVLLLPSSASALELVRAPYLQMTGPTSTSIVFRTDDPCAGAILWGTEAGVLDQAVATGTTTEHVAELADLTPSTEYWYEARCNDLRIDPDAQPSFVTPPPVGERAPLRAWIVGDSGIGAFAQWQVRDAAVSAWGLDVPDLFLHLGDMAYGDGTDSQFTNNFYGVYSAQLRSIPVFPTMGNHEGHTSVADDEAGPYYEGYVLPRGGELGGVASGTEAYYSFDQANVHFIVLESHQSDRSPGSAMLTWLAEDLAATDQEWIVSYWHHPPYTKGSHDSDVEIRHIDMRENALPILEAGGVDLVLGGHSHIYERSWLLQGAYETPSTSFGIVDSGDGKPDGDGPYVLDEGLGADDGTLYVVAGHGGAGTSQDGVHPLMYFAEPANGSVLMDVVGNRMTLRNVRFDSEITDTVTLLKGAGIDVVSPDGTEVLVAGVDTEITWGSAGVGGEATISWTCDDGASWIELGTAPTSSGRFDWTVPAIDTRHGRVRVAADGLEDVSDGRFEVEAGSDTALVPCPDPPPPDVEPDETDCADCGGEAAFLPLVLLGGLGLRRRRLTG